MISVSRLNSNISELEGTISGFVRTIKYILKIIYQRSDQKVPRLSNEVYLIIIKHFFFWFIRTKNFLRVYF